MKRMLPLFLIMLLAACGGGGSSADKSLNFSDINFPSEVQEDQYVIQNITINNSSTLTQITAINLPDWLTFDSSTLSVQGMPSHSDAGKQYTFSFHASDGEQGITSEDVSIRVKHPTLKVSRSIEAYVFKELTDIRFALDIQSDLMGLEYRLINGPNWLAIDSFTGALSGIAPHEDAGRVYENIQVQVTDGIHEAESNIFSIKIEAEAVPSSSLMITEIGGRAYYNSQHWFEIYNVSKAPINLNDYKLNTRAIDKTTCGNFGCNITNQHTFLLHSLIIQPGQYAIVRGQDWGTNYSDSDRVLYIKDSNLFPYWDNDGYVELVKKSDNTTADFVVFGDWRRNGGIPSPVTASAWSGGPQSSSPQSSFQETAYTESLTRYSNLQDNNNSHDWVARSINTPGGPNDVTSHVDNDQDGIPDEAEVEGSTYAGLSLYDMGARVNRKDIFIEVDYMNSSDEGVIPREEALQKVVDAFSEKNIAIHFDVGNLYDQAEGINPARFDLGGGNQVPFSPGVSLGVQPGDTRASAYEIKHSNMDLARLSVFHYMLMANSQKPDGSNGSSGLAELNGNDLIISLGNWNLHSRNERAKNVLINFQAGTIMHELGHNLGLRHGGGDDVNNKPNYVSIMNYMYQLEGLPEIGNNEGDRYYRFRNRETVQSNCNTGMKNPPTSDYLNFKIDYSNEVTSLNEALIYENIGLKQTGSASVDFNCDGLIGTQRKLDVNDSDSIEVLTGHDDWSSLNLRFQSGYSANFNGSKLLENDDVQDSFKLHPDHVGNDIGIVVPEYAPSQEFMDSIKY